MIFDAFMLFQQQLAWRTKVQLHYRRHNKAGKQCNEISTKTTIGCLSCPNQFSQNLQR